MNSNHIFNYLTNKFFFFFFSFWKMANEILKLNVF